MQALYLGSQFSFPPRPRQVAFHPEQKSALLSEKAGVARVVTAATVRAANALRTMQLLSLVAPGFEPVIDSPKTSNDKASTAGCALLFDAANSATIQLKPEAASRGGLCK
jgi:hypothetical protein